MYRFTWLLAVTAALGCAGHARAQDDPQAEPVAPPAAEPDYLALADAPVFLPRSYLYWGTPVGPKSERNPLVFALSYALHLPVYSNLRDQALSGKHWAGAATLSFEGDLRMLALQSKPVRMPSYRPNISGQLFYLLHGPVPTLFGLRTGMFHYSNGQERCTFDTQLADESDACSTRTKAVVNPSAELNRVNFVDRLQQFATGLSWDGERPLKFKPTPARRLDVRSPRHRMGIGTSVPVL